MNRIFTIFVVVFLAGCANIPAHLSAGGIGRGGAGYISVDQGRPQEVRHANERRLQAFYAADPCQPFRADELMNWAKGAGQDSTHTREAEVTNANGRINCFSSERAASRGETRSMSRQRATGGQ